MAIHIITCDSGEQEGFTMLSPSLDGMFGWEAEPDRAEVWIRRFEGRLCEAKGGWICTGDAD